MFLTNIFKKLKSRRTKSNCYYEELKDEPLLLQYGLLYLASIISACNSLYHLKDKCSLSQKYDMEDSCALSSDVAGMSLYTLHIATMNIQQQRREVKPDFELADFIKIFYEKYTFADAIKIIEHDRGLAFDWVPSEEEVNEHVKMFNDYFNKEIVAMEAKDEKASKRIYQECVAQIYKYYDIPEKYYPQKVFMRCWA